MRIVTSSTRIVLLICLIKGGIATAQEPTPNPRLERLRAQIQRVLRNVDGQVGVAVKHLESGQALDVNGSVLFPMASTFKVPVLVELLNQVKEGRYSLDDE